MIPNPVEEWLAEHGFGTVSSSHGVGGGCINNGTRLITSTGNRFFLKTNAHCPPDMFACEVAGLRALNVTGGPRVPEPFLSGPDFLLMEDLSPSQKSRDYWETFGRQLALMHSHTGERFGFEGDNYIGSTTQPNPWMEDGYQFYRENRLDFQVKLAVHKGLLNTSGADAVMSISGRLPELVPDQPASIIHGDLWSGNSISDANGQPAMIDPAAYYGWAEADLAMMVLFGAPGSQFWPAYQEVHPLEIGWRERFDLYNLYHLLNHLNLFGPSYHGQVMRTVRQFV